MIQTKTQRPDSWIDGAINRRFTAFFPHFLRQTAILALFALLAARTVVPQVRPTPAPAVESKNGAIEGIVTQTGAFDPIPNAQITLVPVSAVRTPLASRTNGPQAIEELFAGLEPLGILRTQTRRAAPMPEERVLRNIDDTALIEGVALLNPEYLAVVRKFRASIASFKGVSDAAGRFTIAGVPAGAYTIRVERESYFGPLSDGSSAPAQTKTVTVSENQTVRVEFSLTRGATISGRIRDENDQPVANALVQALRVTYQYGYPVLQTVVTSVTDDRGNYRLFWLAGAEYQIHFMPPRAVSGAGPGALTTTNLRPMRTAYPGTTNLAEAATIRVRTGSAVEGIDFAVRSAKAVRLSGVIHSGVDPPAGASTVRATVLLLPHNPSVPDDTGTRIRASARLNPNTGTFAINNVLPGSYDVYVHVRDAVTPDFHYGGITVNVRDEDIAGLTIDVHPNFTVEGKVRLEDGGAVDANVRINIAPEGSLGKTEIMHQTARPRVRPGSDGSFRVPTAGPGVYRIEVEGLPPQQYVRAVRQGGADVFDGGFNVGLQQPGPIEVTLSSGAGSAKGVVRDESGNPLAGAVVALVPIVPKRLNRTLFRRATTDATGQYSIQSIAPGDYNLFAWESIPEGAFFDPRFLGKDEARSKPVRIEEAGITPADLIVIPGSLR